MDFDSIFLDASAVFLDSFLQTNSGGAKFEKFCAKLRILKIERENKILNSWVFRLTRYASVWYHGS